MRKHVLAKLDKEPNESNLLILPFDVFDCASGVKSVMIQRVFKNLQMEI